jgi:hypothetical protein
VARSAAAHASLTGPLLGVTSPCLRGSQTQPHEESLSSDQHRNTADDEIRHYPLCAKPRTNSRFWKKLSHRHRNSHNHDKGDEQESAGARQLRIPCPGPSLQDAPNPNASNGKQADDGKDRDQMYDYRIQAMVIVMPNVPASARRRRGAPGRKASRNSRLSGCTFTADPKRGRNRRQGLQVAAPTTRSNVSTKANRSIEALGL